MCCSYCVHVQEVWERARDCFVLRPDVDGGRRGRIEDVTKRREEEEGTKGRLWLSRACIIDHLSLFSLLESEDSVTKSAFTLSRFSAALSTRSDIYQMV
jgi:hypothetical protein